MFSNRKYICHIENKICNNLVVGKSYRFTRYGDKNIQYFDNIEDACEFKQSICDMVKYYVKKICTREASIKEVRDEVARFSCDDNIIISMIIDRVYPDQNDITPNGCGCYNIDIIIKEI